VALLIIILSILTFAAIGPIIGRKLFPPPSAVEQFSVRVSYTGDLVKGQKLRINNEDLEIISVEDNQVTLRRKLTTT